MLTLFSTPKAFIGHNKVIQRNAIISWTKLNPKPEIILLGSDKGIEEICKEFDLIHIPDIESNEYGTPLISSIFYKSIVNSSNHILSYVNSDIILFDDFHQSIAKVSEKFENFLLIGRRWDLDINELIDFSNGWKDTVMKNLDKNGKLHNPGGKDYFVFTKKTYGEIPPFAIGRGTWDGWLVHEARKRKASIIEMTDVVKIIHQNHDYGHISAPKRGTSWKGVESDVNASYYKKRRFISINDSQYRLTDNGFIKRPFTYFVYRYIYYVLLHYKLMYKYSRRRISSN